MSTFEVAAGGATLRGDDDGEGPGKLGPQALEGDQGRDRTDPEGHLGHTFRLPGQHGDQEDHQQVLQQKHADHEAAERLEELPAPLQYSR